MKAIVWQKPDNTLAFTYPVGGPGQGETEDQFLDRVAAKAITDAAIPVGWVRLADIDPATLPNSREFRDSWRINGGGAVAPDLTSAKQLVAAKARRKYDEEFKRLQVEKLRAEGDQTATDLVNTDLGTLRSQVAATKAAIQGAANLAQLRAIQI